MVARLTSSGNGSPMPALWALISWVWNNSMCSTLMRVSLSKPTPVLKLYIMGASSCIQVASMKSRLCLRAAREDSASATLAYVPLAGRATLMTCSALRLKPSMVMVVMGNPCISRSVGSAMRALPGLLELLGAGFEPGADQGALVVGHVRHVGQRHVFGLHRTLVHLGSVLADQLRRLQHHTCRRGGKAGLRGLRRVAAGATLRDHFLYAGKVYAACRSGDRYSCGGSCRYACRVSRGGRSDLRQRLRRNRNRHGQQQCTTGDREADGDLAGDRK